MKIINDIEMGTRILLENGTDITDDIALDTIELVIDGSNFNQVKLVCNVSSFEIQSDEDVEAIDNIDNRTLN